MYQLGIAGLHHRAMIRRWCRFGLLLGLTPRILLCIGRDCFAMAWFALVRAKDVPCECVTSLCIPIGIGGLEVRGDGFLFFWILGFRREVKAYPHLRSSRMQLRGRQRLGEGVDPQNGDEAIRGESVFYS